MGTSGLGDQKAGELVMNKGDSQVGGGPCVVTVVIATSWYWGWGAENGARGKLERLERHS